MWLAREGSRKVSYGAQKEQKYFAQTEICSTVQCSFVCNVVQVFRETPIVRLQLQSWSSAHVRVCRAPQSDDILPIFSGMAAPPSSNIVPAVQHPLALPFVTKDGFLFRRLAVADYDSNYMQLLQQLTKAPLVPRETFEAFVVAADACTAGHLVCVAEAPVSVDATATATPPLSADAQPPPSLATGTTLAATATLLVERKLIRGGASVGHIEDVVVDAQFRGKGLGRRLIDALTDEARRRGCYKVILDCAESNVAFYERCGYATKELQMVRYF